MNFPDFHQFTLSSKFFEKIAIIGMAIFSKISKIIHRVNTLDVLHFMCDAHILLHGKKKSLEDSDASPDQNIKKVE